MIAPSRRRSERPRSSPPDSAHRLHRPDRQLERRIHVCSIIKPEPQLEAGCHLRASLRRQLDGAPPALAPGPGHPHRDLPVWLAQSVDEHPPLELPESLAPQIHKRRGSGDQHYRLRARTAAAERLVDFDRPLLDLNLLRWICSALIINNMSQIGAGGGPRLYAYVQVDACCNTTGGPL